MALEQQIADAIIIAFDELGGNPYDAARSALYHRTLESWVNDETTKIAVAGGLEMAIPGLHALTIPAGISYLIHKMAHISWGIGALKGAFIVETANYSDLRNILTIYANDNMYNAAIIDFTPISLTAYQYALSNDGYSRLNTLLSDHERADINARTWQVMRNLSQDYSEDEKAQRLLRLLAGKKVAEQALENAKGRTFENDETNSVEPLERRIGARLALKLAGQLAGRLPAKWVMGFVPIAGAFVNAFFNSQSLRHMAEAAEKYYDNQINVETLETV
jgi:hypothetical protein